MEVLSMSTNWLAVFVLLGLFVAIDFLCMMYTFYGSGSVKSIDKACRVATGFEKFMAVMVGWIFLAVGADAMTVFLLVMTEVNASLITFVITWVLLLLRWNFKEDWELLCEIGKYKHQRKLEDLDRAGNLFKR
jgi:hypothetical protein